MVSIRIKVNLPTEKFATQKWLRKLATQQRQKTVPELRKLFQQTVFGWSDKPSFGYSQSRSASNMSITMYPTGEHAEIWALVSEGARPHTILPRRGRFLRFRPGYRSATVPGQLQSRRSYRSGRYVRALRVNHPGFEARDFPTLIAQEFQDPFVDIIQEAFNEAAEE